MNPFWCILYNNTPIVLRVVVVSNFGSGSYLLVAGQQQWVYFYPGQKTLTAFDNNTSTILAFYSLNVTTPQTFAVVPGTGQQPYSWSVTAGPSGGPPGGG